MTGLIFLVDPRGYIAYYALMVALGITVSIVVFYLLRRPDLRREGYDQWGRVSRRTAGVVALVILAVFIGHAQSRCGGHFFGISKTEDSLVLHYKFPSRDLVFPETKGLVFDAEKVYTKTGMKCRIVVTAPDGSRQTSQPIKIEEATMYLKELNQPPKTP